MYDLIKIEFPEHYPVNRICFKSDMHSGQASIVFSTDTALTLLTLSDLLIPRGKPTYPYKSVFHDRDTEFNQVPRSHHDITIFFYDDLNTINDVLRHIFNKLSALKFINQHTYKDAFNKCFDFAKKYCADRTLHFLGGNYYIRTAELTRSTDALEETAEKEKIEDEEAIQIRPLFNAVRANDVKQVAMLLRSGMKASTLHYGNSLLSYAIPENFENEVENFSNIFDIFNLLLEYSAPIDKGFNQGKALTTIIFNAMYSHHPKLYGILERMIMTLMHLDNGRTYSYLGPQQLASNPLARLIHEGQCEVERGKSFALTRLTHDFKSMIKYRVDKTFIFTPSILQNQQAKLSIETLCLSDVLNNTTLKDTLYQLFNQHPQWKNQMTDEEKKRYFHENVLDAKTDTYIDLIKIQNVIVGYNVAEMVFIESENIVIHHVKLALINLSLLKIKDEASFVLYKGLMLLASHARGFLPLQTSSTTQVITVFEAASPSSILAITAFEYYPKLLELEKYLGVLFDSIYRNEKNNDKLIDDKMNSVWRIKDPLANFKMKSNLSRWTTLSGIAAYGFFARPIYRNGESNIVIYENNPANHTVFLAQTAKYVEISHQTDLIRFTPTAKI